MDTKFKEGDRVILCDVTGAAFVFEEGQTATVVKCGDDRVWVKFDDPKIVGDRTISSSLRRFRLLTPLDELL